MHWLVDGYNVIRRAPDLAALERESLQAGRDALCRLLATAARLSGDHFTVVFDGARGGGSALAGEGVRIIFSSGREKADHVLARLAAPGIAVVSNDRTVRQDAARVGAIAISADEFLPRLQRLPRPRRPEKEEEDADTRLTPKKGNPRRLPKKARAAARALRRLEP